MTLLPTVKDGMSRSTPAGAFSEKLTSRQTRSLESVLNSLLSFVGFGEILCKAYLSFFAFLLGQLKICRMKVELFNEIFYFVPFFAHTG